jgi:uncharacterized protein
VLRHRRKVSAGGSAAGLAAAEEAFSGRELRGGPLRCSIDGSRLVQTERSEILVDACPECRGVWLDRGELDRILVKEWQWASGDPDEDFFREAEGRRQQPREPDRYDDCERYDDRDSGRRKKRRGGFLEDLFWASATSAASHNVSTRNSAPSDAALLGRGAPRPRSGRTVRPPGSQAFPVEGYERPH